MATETRTNGAKQVNCIRCAKPCIYAALTENGEVIKQTWFCPDGHGQQLELPERTAD
jgi:hypothetical protein